MNFMAVERRLLNGRRQNGHSRFVLFREAQKRSATGESQRLPYRTSTERAVGQKM